MVSTIPLKLCSLICLQFFKRVKKAHTWEVPPLDQKEQETLEKEDDEMTRKKLAETLLNSNESKFSR